MDLGKRFLVHALPLVVLLLGALAAPAAAQPRGDISLAHVDGYLSGSPDGRCMVIKQHDGSLYTLVGSWHGLVANDHVRLEGRFVAETRCGGRGGFEVTDVQALWADDKHKSTYYDHLKDGTFRHWVERNRPQELQRRRGD